MVFLAGLAVATGPAFAASALSPSLGSPYATGLAPLSGAFSPNGDLLATGNAGNTVSMFSVGAGGALTQVSGSPFAATSYPQSVAFSPNGSPSGLLLATANSSNSISVFKVAADGVLSAVTGSPFATGPQPRSVAFSPDGKLLATANLGNSTISVFSVAADGTLSAVTGSPFATGTSPHSVAFSPVGGLLATANSAPNTVSVFSVASSGALTEVPGSPFATGGAPVSVAFSSNGGLLATANSSANSVSVFSVDSAGALTQVSGSPFATGAGPVSVAFSSTGGLLATANSSANSVSAFSVASTGALTQLAGSPYATGKTPVSVALNPDGGLVATANVNDSTVSMFFHDTTAPTITNPGDFAVEATSGSGATASYLVTATDPDSTATVTCDPQSGSKLPLGAKTVHCTATDPAGNASATISFVVTVQDTTAPEITVPATLTREATSGSGAYVTYTVTATDLVDGAVNASCTPASNTLFAMGTTKVTCTATDHAGNHTSKDFNVVVASAAAPAITVPITVDEAAKSANGAPVTYVVSAYDAADGPIVPSCSPPSGSWFKVGTTTVTCSATDKSGHTATATFNVTVRDVTPPEIRSVAITAEATSITGAVVDYGAVAVDNVDGSVTATCTPPSGSNFPFGATRVTCTATDKAGNLGRGSFDVVVAHTAGPVLILPQSITAEATGPEGAKVHYTVSANDAIDGPVTPSCAPESGSTFKLGVSTVTCQATDREGHASTATFQVLVRDATPPTLKLPSAMSVGARGPQDAVARYSATAEDVVDGAITPLCKPASGSHFALGTTAVVCTATDRARNRSVGTFTVTVRATAPWLTGVTQTHERWVSGNALPHYAQASPPVGTTFRYHLNQAAQVSFAFTGTTSGRLVGGKCVPATGLNRGKPSCRRTVIAVLQHAGHAGKNTLDFQGRLTRTRSLPPGIYAVNITASVGNHRSYVSTLRFTIIR